MLVLIDDISVMVLRVQGNKVWLGVDAPKAVRVDRDEVRARRIKDAAEAGEETP